MYKRKDYAQVNQSLFDLSTVSEDEDAMSMAHPFEGLGRGLTAWPDALPTMHGESLQQEDQAVLGKEPEDNAAAKQQPDEFHALPPRL